MITRLYIGSNNETKEVEKEKIKVILNNFYNGYTIIDTIGLWQGTEEKSVIIEIIGEEVKKEVIEILKEDLKQYSIIKTVDINSIIEFI